MYSLFFVGRIPVRGWFCVLWFTFVIWKGTIWSLNDRIWSRKNGGGSAWDLDSFYMSLGKVYAETSAILGWNRFGFKGVEKLGCHCSNKVYVSDVNTTCWGNVTSVCNWLPLDRRNTAGSLETRCCFQSHRGQAALDEECLHLPIPGPKRNMQGDFSGLIIALAHVHIFPSVWLCSH